MESNKNWLIKKYHLENRIPSLLLNEMQVVTFKKGEKLFREFETVDFLYIFLSGKCKVSKLLENGIEGIITINKNLQIYGEVELFSKTVANTTIEVLEDCCCLGLEYDECYKLLDDVDFLHFCIKEISKKMNNYDQHFLLNMHYRLKQKLCSYISLTMHNNYFKANHTHLANYLGCSHRQLLRVIKELVTIGVLRKDVDGYIIVDINSLKDMGINE